LFPFVKRKKESDPPVQQQDPAQFERDLVAAANVDLQKTQMAWSVSDKGLLPKCRAAEAAYLSAHLTCKTETDEHTEERKIYVKARAEFADVKTPPLSPTVYWVLFLVITAAEVLFNASVFDIFGFNSKWHTYLMALGIMLAIPSISHIIGTKLREDKKDSVEIYLMVGLVLVLLGGFAGITVWREKFFTGARVLESLGFEAKWEPNSMMFTFYVVNLLIFAAILGLAFESAHRDPEDYKTKKTNLKRAASVLGKEKGELDVATAALLECSERWRKAHSARESEHYKCKSVALKKAKDWMYFVQVYRTANMRARDDKNLPKSFESKADELVDLPADLSSLQMCDKCSYGAVFEIGTTAVEG